MISPSVKVMQAWATTEDTSSLLVYTKNMQALRGTELSAHLARSRRGQGSCRCQQPFRRARRVMLDLYIRCPPRTARRTYAAYPSSTHFVPSASSVACLSNVRFQRASSDSLGLMNESVVDFILAAGDAGAADATSAVIVYNP